MKTDIVTKEWLLKNGFEWREYSNNSYGEHSGEYVLYQYSGADKWVIYFRFKDEGYRDGCPASWDMQVMNSVNGEKKVSMYEESSIPIQCVKDAVKICRIKIRFKKV